MDAITCHRLDLLGIDAARLAARPLLDRVNATYEAFLERLPYENLSNNQACLLAPDDPDSWPRTTDRLLRENRTCGLGGTSFTLAYALRDLMRGTGANAHCTLGHNLVTEEAHAAVVVFECDGPLLYDPALLVKGPVPVRPGGELEDPLGRVTLRPRSGATLTLCLQMRGMRRERPVYSIIPMPARPQAFRQAWIASFYRGRVRPLRMARRVGDEIRRYGERPGHLEVIRCDGRHQQPLPKQPVDDLHELFGISRDSLATWFKGPHAA